MLPDKNLYYVGGVVRDEFLNKQSPDTDLCYEGNAISFAREQGFDIIKENPEFGTVRITYEGKETDIASTRTESYPRKGHLPVVSNLGCSLKDDLTRRDFTINAMAKRTTDNELIDYFGGKDDLNKKLLRVLHKNSFTDDPTRILRGLKFAVRFGFELSEDTRKLQEEYLADVNYDMSYHRLRKELTDAFGLNRAEIFDRFNAECMYKLLGADVKQSSIKGEQVKRLADAVKTEYVWLFYAAPFITATTQLPLTRAEKRILEWAYRLKTQEPVNNTPKESIILSELIKNVD